MAHTYPLDIAVHASNLSERMRTAAALGGAAGPSIGPLDPVDTWRIERLAAKLADKFQQEAVHRSLPARWTREELADVLAFSRRHELGQVGTGRDAAEFVAELHDDWLPTYRTALDRFASAPADGASWREFDVYYGRFAKACEPFLVELGRRLDAVRGAKVNRKVVEDLQLHLLGRFELSLAWAVEADAKVHCSRTGIDQAAASQQDYLAYLDSTFADAVSYHRFYLKFPVLGRWLAHVTAMLGDYGTELLRNLGADAAVVGETFFGRSITEFRSVGLGLSDFHAGARSVVRVEVALADGREDAFYYKPRCIRSAAATQRLLGRLADDGVVGFATRKVLPRDGYGYEAAIPSGRNHVDTDQIIPAVYLKRVTRTGFEDGLFAAWRTDPSFILNLSPFDKGSVLVAGPDFGTGSSREHAVWALMDFGFRVVISSRFADIFRGNAGKAGLLAAEISQDDVELLWKLIEEHPGMEITVNLQDRNIVAGTVMVPFNIDDYTAWRLLEGLDDIGLTLRKLDEIESYEAHRPDWKPRTLPA